MSTEQKYLIVNADDFGLSRDINRGIIETFERGIVTSASLMVRQPAAAEAAEYAKHNQNVSIGLHLDLGEWVYRDGEWVQLYEVIPTDDAARVEKEIYYQLDRFRNLVGRDPSHLDSHQHVHRNEPVRSIMLSVARELNVVLRDCDPTVQYCGDFYGQDGEGLPIANAISLENLTTILKKIGAGTTELGCHPGYISDLQSPYRQERQDEIRVLSNPDLHRILAQEQIQLRRHRSREHTPSNPRRKYG